MIYSPEKVRYTSMSELEFAILKTIYTQPNKQAHRQVLFTIDNKLINEIKSAVDDLVILGIIEFNVCSNKYNLTKDGLAIFRLAKKEREQIAKQEKQQRFNNNVSVANLLVPLVTFILGILIEHFADFISFIFSFF